MTGIYFEWTIHDLYYVYYHFDLYDNHIHYITLSLLLVLNIAGT